MVDDRVPGRARPGGKFVPAPFSLDSDWTHRYYISHVRPFAYGEEDDWPLALRCVDAAVDDAGAARLEISDLVAALKARLARSHDRELTEHELEAIDGLTRTLASALKARRVYYSTHAEADEGERLPPLCEREYSS